jgi:MSHA biogenesis protein MshL
MKTLLCLVLAVALASATESSPLDQTVGPLQFEKAPLPATLRTLGRATKTAIHAEPEIVAEITVDFPGGSLRDALTALVEPTGLYFEATPAGVMVRVRKTVLYPIDYPQLTRSGSGSASITLGGATGGGSGGFGNSGFNGATSQANAQSLANGNTASDATQVSVSQENQNTFWTNFETELRGMLKDGDTLVLNRFSGVAQIAAPVRRHESIRAFIELVNRRITQQVEIEARLVEVTLRDEQKLGVDWDVASTMLDGVRVQARSPVEVSGVGGTVLGANTFAATLGFGRASAVIQALKQQGEVKTVAQPRLRALNNQTAFIKVGEDRPFFRLQQATTCNSRAPRPLQSDAGELFGLHHHHRHDSRRHPADRQRPNHHARRAPGDHALAGHRHQSGRPANCAGHRSETGVDHRAVAGWRNRRHRRADLGGKRGEHPLGFRCSAACRSWAPRSAAKPHCVPARNWSSFSRPGSSADHAGFPP